MRRIEHAQPKSMGEYGQNGSITFHLPFARVRIGQLPFPGLILLLSQWVSAPVAHTASLPQKGYELSGSLQPEFLLDELRGLVGRTFWVRRPDPGQAPKALFCDKTAAPTTRNDIDPCVTEKYGVSDNQQFTIEALIVGKPNPAQSWLKIKFSAEITAYLGTGDFKDNRYTESRVSAAAHGIDYALANAGWIFDDYPAKILDQRRAQHQADNISKAAGDTPESERITRLKLLYIGMTAQQVLNSSWGRPDSVTTTVLGHQRLEQWDYGNRTSLYFGDGRLQRIQAGRQ
jgi:hypothetical protein